LPAWLGIANGKCCTVHLSAPRRAHVRVRSGFGKRPARGDRAHGRGPRLRSALVGHVSRRAQAGRTRGFLPPAVRWRHPSARRTSSA